MKLPRCPYGPYAYALSATLLLGTVGADSAMPPLPAYPPIAALVNAVQATRLKAAVDRLVGFGTRNDFSETSSTRDHGVFGARDWIAGQFPAIAATTNGRMSVALDTYVQSKTPRTPRAVTESSVIATLRGTMPGRVYVMSSHFDDCDGRCTDGAGIAPGADDNGSSVAAVLEAARVMASTRFRGTISSRVSTAKNSVFGGPNHYARELAAAHAPVSAVLNDESSATPSAATERPNPTSFAYSVKGFPRARIRSRELVGSENDSPSRELSRFIAEVVPVYVTGFYVRQIFRADRFHARRRSRVVSRCGRISCSDTFRRSARELRASASRRTRGKRRPIRRPSAIHRRASIWRA